MKNKRGPFLSGVKKKNNQKFEDILNVPTVLHCSWVEVILVNAWQYVTCSQSQLTQLRWEQEGTVIDTPWKMGSLPPCDHNSKRKRKRIAWHFMKLENRHLHWHFLQRIAWSGKMLSKNLVSLGIVRQSRTCPAIIKLLLKVAATCNSWLDNWNWS